MKYEIIESSVAKLRKLEQFKIIILCDDSGSMSSPENSNQVPSAYQAVKSVRLD